MVSAKPMQLTMVSAVPTYIRGAVCATMVENCGLSPTTANPQMTNAGKKIHLGKKNRNGEIRQNMPDSSSIANATFALPFFMEI